MHDDLELRIRQFLDAWDLLAHAGPAYALGTSPGVEWIFSGIPASSVEA